MPARVGFKQTRGSHLEAVMTNNPPSGHNPGVLGSQDPNDEGTDLLGGREAGGEDLLGGPEPESDELGGPEPESDELGGPDPGGQRTDLMGGADPG
jgi:hypothetical protein